MRTERELIDYWLPEILKMMRIRLDNLEWFQKNPKAQTLRDFATELQQIKAPITRAFNECMANIGCPDLDEIVKNIFENIPKTEEERQERLNKIKHGFAGVHIEEGHKLSKEEHESIDKIRKSKT